MLSKKARKCARNLNITHKMCITKVSHNDKTAKMVVDFWNDCDVMWARLFLEIKINFMFCDSITVTTVHFGLKNGLNMSK